MQTNINDITKSKLVSSVSGSKKHLRVAIFNLMPTVLETEKQWKDALSNNDSVIVDIIFFNSLVRPSSKVDKSHLDENYSKWTEYDFNNLDGIIITGAPVELLDFNDVDFYPEICEVISKSIKYDISLMLICWAALAALHYLYNVDKICLDEKLFGVYDHNIVNKDHPLVAGFSKNNIKVCISRQSQINTDQAIKYTRPILRSNVDGMDCLEDISKPNIIYMFNHLEYTEKTLDVEFQRDINSTNIKPPQGYYQIINNHTKIQYSWKKDKEKFYSNWLDTL